MSADAQARVERATEDAYALVERTDLQHGLYTAVALAMIAAARLEGRTDAGKTDPDALAAHAALTALAKRCAARARSEGAAKGRAR